MMACVVAAAMNAADHRFPRKAIWERYVLGAEGAEVKPCRCAYP